MPGPSKDFPTFKDMMPPVVKALKDMGGSGVNGDIDDRVADMLLLDDDQRFAPHGAGGATELGYRCGWARSYLKKAGYIGNTSRGMWVLTAKGQGAAEINAELIAKEVRDGSTRGRPMKASEIAESSEPLQGEISDEESPEAQGWKQRLSEVLVNMDPSAFERLFAAILNEYGFEDVVVSGKAGDEGIDGYGYVRIQGLLTECVTFQCKRYAPHRPIGPNLIREFRGAMQSRSRKGLFVTTSRFTEAARHEARRNDVPIDLIDGSDLAEILCERGMGVREVKDYAIDESYFLMV